MKVFILTEGGNKIGLGHLTRCSALYDAFKDRGINPLFVANTDKNAKNILKNKKYIIFNWVKQKTKLFKMIQGADIVVIDSYLSKEDIYKKVSEISKVPVFLDDNKRIDYPCGIIVNGSVYAEFLKYPKKNGTVYLLGPEYQPVRREFWKVPIKTIRKNIKNILITFGGDDPHNMTTKVLALMVKYYPHLEKKIIIGSCFKNTKAIKNAGDSLTRLFYSPDAEKIKQIMLDADIAISAAGQTLNELARIGVPVIAVATAENQLNNVFCWRKAGYIEYAGCWYQEKKILKNIINFIELLKDRKLRAAKHTIGKSYINGQGSRKVISTLLSPEDNNE